jgi:hypothetical protein
LWWAGIDENVVDFEIELPFNKNEAKNLELFKSSGDIDLDNPSDTFIELWDDFSSLGGNFWLFNSKNGEIFEIENNSVELPISNIKNLMIFYLYRYAQGLNFALQRQEIEEPVSISKEPHYFFNS